MDATSKSTGTTILGRIQNGRHSEQYLSYLCDQWIKFNDVNINFTYFEVNGFICLNLNMIRVIYLMFRPFFYSFFDI